LPNYTTSAPGPSFSNLQLGFISFVTIVLYGVFLYTQTILHKDHFIGATASESAAHAPATTSKLIVAGVLLVLSLTAIVLLSKKFGVIVDQGVDAIGVPNAAAGVIIALLILLPEGIAAINAARQDNLQKSLNLALGSSLATIGLTLPAVAVANISLQQTLVLGLGSKEMTLLVMTLATSIVTFGTGRTNILFGFLHLVVFAIFMFLVFVP
jgi:Ca2+:H+ antiporter